MKTAEQRLKTEKGRLYRAKKELEFMEQYPFTDRAAAVKPYASDVSRLEGNVAELKAQVAAEEA